MQKKKKLKGLDYAAEQMYIHESVIDVAFESHQYFSTKTGMTFKHHFWYDLVNEFQIVIKLDTILEFKPANMYYYGTEKEINISISSIFHDMWWQILSQVITCQNVSSARNYVKPLQKYFRPSAENITA